MCVRVRTQKLSKEFIEQLFFLISGFLNNVETDAKWWFYKDAAAVLWCYRDDFVMILSMQR